MSSSFLKTQLKAARDAIQNKNYEYSQGLCEDILENDPENYNALVFLGLCLKELKKSQESESIFEKAIASQPTTLLAYTGVLKLYESENNIQGQMKVYEKLGEIYRAASDGEKYLETLMKRLDMARAMNHQDLVVNLLKECLPASKGFSLIKDLDSCPTPSTILRELVENKEKKLNETMAKELNERRMRLGSDPLPVLKVKVEQEFIMASDLENDYESLLELPLEYSPLELFQYSNQYLDFMLKKLRYVLDQDSKSIMRQKIIKLMESILNSRNYFSPLACSLAIESLNQSIGEKNLNSIIPFMNDISSSQDTKCKVVKALVQYQSNHFNLDEDSLAILLQIVEDGTDEYLAVIILADFYWRSNEFATAFKYANKALPAMLEYQSKYAFDLSKLILDMKLCIAFCQSQMGDTLPALDLYKAIVLETPDLKEGLFGLGKIYIDMNNLADARKCFERISTLHPQDIESKFEIGWILFLEKRLLEALDLFKSLLQINPTGLAYYRLARVFWELGGEYRENKDYTHAHLIQAIKIDSTFSPSFSFLGDFYRIQENDLTRAVKCYTKAISINPADENAVLSLCTVWIFNKKIKEATSLLQQFVMITPRSKWAWKQLGILELDDTPLSAITRFQTSLRIVHDDPDVWLCLGEAYAKEGKYVASLKAFDRAKELNPNELLNDFLKAAVYQKLGQHSEAIDCYESLLTRLPDESLKKRIPAIHGLAETRLHYARELHEQGCFGACLENLTTILTLFKENEFCNYSLYKVSGDACIEIHKLLPFMVSPEIGNLAQICHDLIVSKFSDKLIAKIIVPSATTDTCRLLNCAYFFYQACLIETPSSKMKALAGFYHDISISSFYLYEETNQEPYLLEAIKFEKNALSISPSQWIFWNSLGIYCQTVDKQLSQHAFIKAIECDGTKAIIWSNLGFFYLHNNDIGLASQCFEKAQFVDLDCPFGWFGQAITSELLGHEKVFEMYEHSNELAQVSNPDILYQFAKQCFLNPEKHSMPLVAASFALQKCYEMNFKNSNLLNLYGLVLEKQQRIRIAIEMFQEALALLTNQNEKREHLKNAINENLGRCLCRGSRFSESISAFEKIDNGGDSYTLLGLGLAYFFNEQYEESLSVFQKTLSLSEGAKDVQLVNNVNLVLSQVLYALGGTDQIALAKQQLFQCFTNDAKFVPALLGLCSMGIVQKDWTLAQTAAAELIKLGPHVTDKYDADVDFVLGSIFAASNQIPTVKRFYAKSIHRYPWKAKRWSNLAEFMYSQLPNMSKLSMQLGETALKVASHVQPSLRPDLESIDIFSEIYRVFALSSISAKGETKNGRRLLSRAIHLNPSSAKNWLAMTIELGCEFSKKNGENRLLVQKTANAVQIFDSEMLGIWSEMMKIHLQLQEDSDLESVQASLSIVDGICSSSTGLLQQAGYTLLARGLILLNNNDAAIQALQQAISMNNREDSLPWNTPSFILAKLLIGLKQLPAAVEVLRLCKNDVFAQLFESCLHILKNDYNSAFEVVGKLLKELPDCQTAKFIQLVILAHNHKYIEEETGKKKNLARIVKARSQMVEDGIGTEGLDLIDTFIEEIS